MKKIIIFLMFLGVSTLSQATIYYVKVTPSGFGNGTSWANASGNLQTMINKANFGDTIWVAKGTYKPTHNRTMIISNPNDRNNTFTLKNGVVILGGFPNTGNPDLNDRNWATDSTILSGNIGNPNDSTDNAYHVVYAENLGTQTVLDGFVITNGYANGGGGDPNRGGGIFADNSSALFINLIVRNSYATSYGGGVFIRGNSLLKFFNILIYNNTAGSAGGGVYTEGASYPLFVNVTITKNRLTPSGGDKGGGFRSRSAPNPSLSPYFINSIISGNMHTTTGGDSGEGNIYFDVGYNNARFTNCLVGPILSSDSAGIILHTDPQFVNPTANDFRLKPNSLAIDAGKDTCLTGIITDLGGNPRIYNSYPDLGAYESQGTPIIPDTNGIVYVNKNVTTGDGSGRSWYNAAIKLADALRVAKSSNAIKADSIRQIWVAQATYTPLYSAEDGHTSDNGYRNNAFVMVKNVQVYGGFPWDADDSRHAPNNNLTMEQALNTRRWKNFPTILSGDIGNQNDNTDNCYHVVISSGDVGTACLDGFFIRKGNADSLTSITVNGETIPKNRGGGIYSMSSSRISSSFFLRNISIDTNEAIADGGGMYAHGSYTTPKLINVFITENKAKNGGGLYSHTSSIELTNVTISKNKATTDGGGMYNQVSMPIMTNVLLVKNTANNMGGGMYNFSSFYRLTNVTISSNVAGNDAGGIKNVTMLQPPNLPQIRNTIIWGNKTANDTASNVINDLSGVPVYSHCLVEGGPISNGIILDTDPMFADTLNGYYHLTYCSPAINVGENNHYSFPPLPNTPDLSKIVIDLDSNDRIHNRSIGGIVDLGAYESPYERILPSLSAGVKDTTICYGDTIEIKLLVEGTSPWNFLYTKDYGITIDTLPISNNPHIWKISPTDTITYNFVKVNDYYCSITLSDSIRVNVIPKPTLTNTLSDKILCHGDTTEAIAFAGTTDYEWISFPQVEKIPNTVQTSNFGKYEVENTTSSDTTTTITIVPLYKVNSITCAGDTSRFTITVLPKPTLTNIFTNDTLCHGDTTEAITFAGTATDYQWISSPEIDNIPVNTTGHFGKYTVINTSSSDTTTTITIIPQYTDLGKTCIGKDTSRFTITVLPKPMVANTFTNDTLCYGDTTKTITFIGTATKYQWTSNPQIDNIPVDTTGDFKEYPVKNPTSSHLTTTISVIPQYTLNTITCIGRDTMTFTITAFPDPALTNTNIPSKDTLCHGTQTDSITFTGNANTYQWTSIPQIDNIPTAHTGHFGKYTVINTTSSDTTTTIKVIPQYEHNGKVCKGKDTSFTITVLPNPTVTNMPKNDTLCHGEQTTSVTFTGSADIYQWESSILIDSIPTGIQTNPFGTYTVVNTTNAPLVTKITVTPQRTFSGKVCNGDDTSFTITVNPLPVITNIPSEYTLCDGEQTTQFTFTNAFTFCQWENIGDTVPGIPLGVQTNNDFLNYTVNNYTDSVITAIINIKAEYNNGAICAMPDTNFKIHINPTPKVDSLPSDTIILCSGSKTDSIVFSGVATSYEWQVRGDTIGLPLTAQTGKFGEYLLENKGNTPLTAFVDVTPSFSAEGKTCQGITYTFAVTVNPVPEVEYVPADYVLCNGDTTTIATFGTAVRYEWTVSGDVIPGLPTGQQTGDFGEYVVENKTSTPLTAIITVSPVYTVIGQNCTVKDTFFRISVNPEPFITNITSDQILCSGEQTTETVFTGVFTNYEWQIDENITGIPPGIQTDNFGEYTVENRTTAPLKGIVSIDVYYTANGLSCVNHDTLFDIIVNPEPTVLNTLSDETLCSGEKTTPIIFTGSATSYEWEALGNISELPKNPQTGDFGSYTLTNNGSYSLSATITIIPIYSGSGIVCKGAAQQFDITVDPVTKIDSITANAFFFCEGEELRIKVSASGGNLTYQWYYNGTSLSGETSEYYIVSKSSRLNSGVYYAEVSGACGVVKSSSVMIDVRDEKMLVEKWHDVILVDNSTYDFFGYQWYRNGKEIAGATEQFYQEIGGLKGCYSVELTLAGGAKIHSCERCVDKVTPKSLSIYPNPTKQGASITVNPGQDNNQTANVIRIEVYNTDGQLIISKQVDNNDIFEIETNNLSAGIYLLRIISSNEQIHNEKIIVY